MFKIAFGDILTEKKIEAVQSVVMTAMEQSSEVLSQMTGIDLSLFSPKVGLVPIEKIPAFAGGAESEAVGVYLGVDGDIMAHMLLVFPTKSAFELTDTLLENPAGTTLELDAMGRSCLGEVGNVTGSFFLNTLAERTGLFIKPSPPEVILDMLGAILSMILAELSMQSDEGLLIETAFTEKTKQIKGFFFLIPIGDSMDIIMSALGVES